MDQNKKFIHTASIYENLVPASVASQISEMMHTVLSQLDSPLNQNQVKENKSSQLTWDIGIGINYK